MVILLLTAMLANSNAISVGMLQREFDVLHRIEVDSGNIFGIPPLHGTAAKEAISATITRLLHRSFLPKKKELPKRIYPNFRTSKTFKPEKEKEKILLYRSSIRPKINVRIVEIRKIKRIGGEYPYGPPNGTIVDLKEPIFIVSRNVDTVDLSRLRKNSGLIGEFKWNENQFSSSNNTSHLPPQVMSSDLECRYCYSYWSKQHSHKPTNVFKFCCFRPLQIDAVAIHVTKSGEKAVGL